MTDDNAGKLFKHILSYVNEEKKELDNVVVEAVFKTIEPQLKKSMKKEVVDKIDWNSLELYFSKITGKKIRGVNDKAKRQFRARMREGYTKSDIANAIKNCYNSDYHRETNHKYLTLEFISRPDKLEMYSSIKENKESISIKQDKINK